MGSTYNNWVEREKKSIMSTYGRYPLAVARAAGNRLYDPEGREYVDLLAGIAVNGLGHCHPALNKAMIEQAETLGHVSNLFYQEPQILLAEKLLATCDADKVFFCNSGAEANEGAIKLARRYMRKVRGVDAHEIVTLEGSFHGRTLATLTATGQSGKIKDGFGPLPSGFRTVPFGDVCALRGAVTDATAAVMVEMVQGEGGVRPLPEEFVDALLALREEKGFLLIVDEVQTGLCRTGSFWAHQRFNVRPDIFTTAKALANGLPMGAVLATDEAAKGFEPGSHATTFGGGPVVAAVASKVLDLMLEERLAERAELLGAFAHEALRGVVAEHPDKILSLRGMGLMIGVELAFPGQDVWRALLDKGFVLNLTQGSVLRLLPPLTIEEADLTAFAAALAEVLRDVER
ncbi:aspartate aminotransferase family protein [Paucidesulfovibrio longus]|uniref:aspartate aminotransferase family protein n=1 Tax=Paucidesulfovibrio longus TaxID=889 RepID=UPI0003B72B71|nr:aspartate aminotransferase family protein [Paucidesulfovibrio longus]